MKRFINRRLGTIGGAVVGSLAAAGVGIAAIPSAGGEINGCYRNNGTLRLIDAEAGQTCLATETAISWNAEGAEGPQGPAGPQGPEGPEGPPVLAEVLVDRNFQDVPLAPFPGVTVASLVLPEGEYTVLAKFRYRNFGDESQSGGCIYQGDGVGGLDASEHNVPPGGAAVGTADGVIMDTVRKRPGDDSEVRVQCFGDRDLHIINTQLHAIPAQLTIQ